MRLGMVVRRTCLRVGAGGCLTWLNVKVYSMFGVRPMQLLPDRDSRAHKVCSRIVLRWYYVALPLQILALSVEPTRDQLQWTNHQRQNNLLVAFENEDMTHRKRQHNTTLAFSLKDQENTPHGWTRYPRRHILSPRKGSKVLRVMTLAEGTQKTSR